MIRILKITIIFLKGSPAINDITTIIANRTPIEPKSLCMTAINTPVIINKIKSGLNVFLKSEIVFDCTAFVRNPANQSTAANLTISID